MQLQDVECPSCGAPVANLPHPSAAGTPGEALFHCRFCGTQVDLNRALCPHCALLNRERERSCGRCGSQIVRVCPFCKQENWAGNESCIQCGRTLDLLEIMIQPASRDTRARLEAQRRQARLLKAQEEHASEARLARLWEMEHQRVEGIARDTGEKQRRERLVLAGIVLVIAFTVLLVIGVLVVSGLGS